MKTIEKIKIGSLVTMYNGIYAVLIGLAYIVFSDWILKINFKPTGSLWGFFVKYNPEIGALFTKFMIQTGIMIIIVGICIIYLSTYILKKKDRMAWAVLFIIGITFWSSLLVMEALNKNYYTIIINLIGWVGFITGMILPGRYYLSGSYEED